MPGCMRLGMPALGLAPLASSCLRHLDRVRVRGRVRARARFRVRVRVRVAAMG